MSIPLTFSEAYAAFGPDTVVIAGAMGITEAEADRLVNERMEQRARNSASWQRRKAELAELRAERPA